MASEPRRWPALVVRSAEVDATGELAGLVTLALDGCALLAIEELTPLPLPPGGLWDPTTAPPPEPPPTAIYWRMGFRDEADRSRAQSSLADLARDLTIESVDLPDENWVARSQRALTAITAGPFVVAPPWDVPATVARGQHLIVIEPSMGFGTGHHATTRLCLRALGRLDVAGQTVVDLGTGSGVLAMAAALAGAGAITGIDNDPDAVAAAERSAALNVLPRPVRFVVGDIAAPRSAADLVLANLTGAMLIRDADQLSRWVKDGGRLVVSGFMEDERPGVESGLSGFTVESRLDDDGWCALTLRRAGCTISRPGAAAPSACARSSPAPAGAAP